MVKELTHLGRVHRVQFAKDNDYLLSTGDDGVKLWAIQHEFKQFNIGESKHESLHQFPHLIDLVIVNSQYRNSAHSNIKI